MVKCTVSQADINVYKITGGSSPGISFSLNPFILQKRIKVQRYIPNKFQRVGKRGVNPFKLSDQARDVGKTFPSPDPYSSFYLILAGSCLYGCYCSAIHRGPAFRQAKYIKVGYLSETCICFTDISQLLCSISPRQRPWLLDTKKGTGLFSSRSLREENPVC